MYHHILKAIPATSAVLQCLCVMHGRLSATGGWPVRPVRCLKRSSLLSSTLHNQCVTCDLSAQIRTVCQSLHHNTVHHKLETLMTTNSYPRQSKAECVEYLIQHVSRMGSQLKPLNIRPVYESYNYSFEYYVLYNHCVNYGTKTR